MRSAGVLREYCQLETFRPECWKNEAVVVDEAVYGRRHVTRCVRDDEKAFLDDPRFFDCYADARPALDHRCDSRRVQSTELNWTLVRELDFAMRAAALEYNVLRTSQALTVLVSLQSIKSS